MDKAEGMAHASRNAGALLADAERRLVDSIERAESRAALGRNARLVRHMQLLVLRFDVLAGSATDEARVAWQRMSEDDIIAAYAKQIR